MTKFTKTLKVLNQSVSYLLMLFSLFLSNSLLSQTENDWTKYNLKGKVRSIKEVSYKIKEEFGSFYKDKEEWDNPFVNDLYVPMSIQMSMQKSNKYIIFNRKGFEVESVLEGKLMDLTYLYKYLYNDYGILSEKTTYDADGRFIRKYKYSFLKGSVLSSKILLGDDGHPLWMYKYEYDDDENLILKDSFFFIDGIGRVETIHLYEYDYRGNNTLIKEYNSARKLMTATFYEYDNKSNVIEKYITWADGEHHIKRHYTYNFDINGNWISCFVWIDEKPEYVIEREIQYF